MKFQQLNINNALGWMLAHSVTTKEKKLPKGTLITEEVVNTIEAGGIKNIQAFILEEHDIDEDTAAVFTANQICGDNLTVVAAGRGRANLIATQNGLFLPGKAIDTINLVDDAFSAASLPPYKKVNQGQLVATVKLVPYAIEKNVLNRIEAQSEKACILAFDGMRAALISTAGPISNKTSEILKSRLRPLNIALTHESTAPHDPKELADALSKIDAQEHDIILILGASAISDIRDIVPTALNSAGGKLVKLGMPADPGNLLMLGILREKTVIGLPGCARSPALNGLDFILERLAAGLDVDHASVTLMGTGGLLKETPDRKTPRIPPKINSGKAHVAAVVLAAGRATRAQGISKLLSKIGNKSVVEATVGTLIESGVLSCHLITGHNADAVTAQLTVYNIKIIHNDCYTHGMGSSLAKGVKAAKEDAEFAMICLADMPFITSATYQKLINVAQNTTEPAIIIPTFHGKRGHPVLWHHHYFSELQELDGDTGGKHIIEKYGAYITEVPVDDAGILIDLDTPEMLKQFGVTAVNQ